MPTLSPAERRVLAFTIGFVLIRIASCLVVGLGMDESYSTAISRELHLSYFDHPPMHQWLAHAAGEVFGYGRWARLPFIALFAGTSWLMFRLTERLFGETAGVWASLALNLSAFFSLAAGDWVLPDGPLIFYELATALVLTRLFFPRPGEPNRPWLLWSLAGFCLGLAALSKYQAMSVALGFGLFALTTREGRRALAHPGPYVGLLVAAATASPTLVWNAQHHWVSFAFQSERGAPSRLMITGPLQALAGQMALLLPWIFAPLALTGWRAARAGPADARRWFCLTAGAPTILLFTLLPLLGSKALPHWPMPGWVLLFPLLGDGLARWSATGRLWPRRWAWASAALLLAIWGLAASDASTAWMKDAFPNLFRKTDPTYEVMEWSRLRADIERRGLLKPGMFVVAAEWNEAGKIDQALGDAAPVLVFSQDPRQYAFRNHSAAFLGRDALIIGRAPTVRQEWDQLKTRFVSLQPQAGFSVGRGDKREVELTVILAHALTSPYPLPPWARR